MTTPSTDQPRASRSEGIKTLTITSAGGELRATFAPRAGMVCCSLQHRDEQLLATRNGLRAYAEQGSTMGIPLLHPWANRLAGFAYGAPGELVELPRDSPLIAHDSQGLPIHGAIAGKLPWQALAARPGDRGARLRARVQWERADLLALFPFPHSLEVSAQVRGAALQIDTTLSATGQVAVPVSFGYHPYLTLPGATRESWQVELPITRELELDARMIPTGASEAVAPRSFGLGQSGWDNAYSGLADPPLFALSAGARRIELEFLEGYSFAQVYSPPNADFICFEPMTAPTNALVSQESLPLVAPGQQFRAAFRISILT